MQSTSATFPAIRFEFTSSTTRGLATLRYTKGFALSKDGRAVSRTSPTAMGVPSATTSMSWRMATEYSLATRGPRRRSRAQTGRRRGHTTACGRLLGVRASSKASGELSGTRWSSIRKRDSTRGKGRANTGSRSEGRDELVTVGRASNHLRRSWSLSRVCDDHGEELGGSVPRLLYIVSRRNQQLYADLTRTSTGDRTVGVMLDRRHGERRQRAASSCRSPSERTALVEYRRTPPAAGLGSRGREVGC